jgi:saccharopine dehydrogenase-like NADP-dependent oxidoreductase
MGLDVRDGAALDAAIAEHDLVVSLVPWQLHPEVARACITRKVDMVTTSYVSPAMEAMHDDAKAAGVTILNEIGLDPGIDHLGAMRVRVRFTQPIFLAHEREQLTCRNRTDTT